MPRAPGLAILKRELGGNWPNIGAALRELELFAVFAGVHAFRLNTAGPGFDEDSPWANTGMSNPRYDKRAKALLIGHFRDSKDPKGDLAAWKKVTPAWANHVRAHLDKAGIPFGVELLRDAAINLNGEPPLFDAKAAPPCLAQLTSGPGSGENGYLRSLGADTLLLEVWPPYYRQHHRKAGSKAPYPQGLTFGSPYYDEKTGTFLRSPLMSTPSYDRWNKAGQPA